MTQQNSVLETHDEKIASLEKELSECEDALLHDSENANLLFQKGFIYNQLGKYEEAITFIEKSILLEPTVKKYLQLGLAYCEIDNISKSLEAYDKALELDPKNPETHNCKGFVHYIDGNLNAAMAEYHSALDLDENYTDAILNLGFVFDEIGNHNSAIQLYDRIISINPHDCCAYLNKGISLLSSRRYGDAINEFEKSIQLRNDDSCSHFNKGYAHYCSDELQEALNEFDIAIRLDEKYVDAYYYKGLILADLRQIDDAIEQYHIALEKGYQDNGVFETQGDICRQKSWYSDALRYYIVAANYTTSENFQYHIGECYYKTKQYEEALAHLSKVKLKRKSSGNRNNHGKQKRQSSTPVNRLDLMMADSYFAIGKYNDAAEFYYKILEDLGNNSSNYHFKDGKNKFSYQKKIAKKFKTAVEKIPQRSKYLHWKVGVEYLEVYQKYTTPDNVKFCKYKGLRLKITTNEDGSRTIEVL